MDKKEALAELSKFKKRVSKEFPLENLILFGSLADDKAGEESDIDLLLVSREFSPLNFIERAARMYDFWSLRHPVDFLCYTPEEFKRKASGVTIVSEALRKGVPI